METLSVHRGCVFVKDEIKVGKAIDRLLIHQVFMILK